MSERSDFPPDHRQRQLGLDVSGSFIVQAPAGSGKTELLIQRILALLAIVDQPEEILAITFTRKAAAEMRRRLLEALEQADKPAPSRAHAAQTWTLARAVMARDRERGWCLLDSPARLQLMTIDSFCAALVRRMPYLARFGETPAIADDPADLYRRAVERLLARLERGGRGSAAIERLLEHLGNRMPLLRDLLVAMLGRRDQWLRHLDPANSATTRPDLEYALNRQIITALDAVQSALGAELLTEAFILGCWAAENLARQGVDNPLAPLCGQSSLPPAAADALPSWLALAQLLLTDKGSVRRSVDVRQGFPVDDRLCREMKHRMLAVFERLQNDSPAVERLRELRCLPCGSYTEEQWDVLAALIELLPLAERDLRETFRLAGEVDFVEIARGAQAALGDDLAPGDLLLHLDARLRHILVDEFQDTSRGQYELLSRLTAGWEEGDGRTLFVVGDPMQSIYRFREAEVGLYLRVRARGLATVRLAPLILSANFRSQEGLVDWFNAVFARLFPVVEDEMRGAVPFSAAAPVRESEVGTAVTLTCFAGRDDAAEAGRIVALIRQARIDDPEGTIAVLVRSRSHLQAIIPALRAAGISWQAQEIEPLGSRPVVRDLTALTRTLLHPADRVAWLSVLRAPWCGLRLDDLLEFCGHDDAATLQECLTAHEDQPLLLPRFSAEGQSRLDPVVAVLEEACSRKGRVPLRRLVESAWLALNGPAGLTAGDLADAGQFFALLEDLDEGGDIMRLETLDERLASLFAAPDPLAGSQLQLMTIHKAKGLEFDTVIVPGLGRSIRPPERPLLLWQEQPEPADSRGGLLLAPIPASAEAEQEPTYRALSRIHADKDSLETLRLFYVAATRARRRLHLFGHARRDKNGILSPSANSLLKAAWQALGTAAEAGVIESTGEPEPTAGKGVLLHRLSLDARVSLPAPALQVISPASRRASDSGHHEASRPGLSLRIEEGRIVGTIVHGWLERISREGVDRWPEDRLSMFSRQLDAHLFASGVPRQRVEACSERALTALCNTLRSPRGRWILGEHREASSELALTGVIDGIIIHAVIDRTFIDADGVRWIIDYKTSMPGEGESVEVFLDRERERYRPQLDDYRKLLMMTHTSIRTALYFPLLDIWCEMG